MEQFVNDEELKELVRRFETCELALAEFSHTRHLAVGIVCLAEADFAAALGRMRTALRRFSAHHGKMGYHETITRFWLLKLDELVRANCDEPLWKLGNLAAASLGDQSLIYDYYDRERLMSDEARQGWVEPKKREIIASGAGPECRMPV